MVNFSVVVMVAVALSMLPSTRVQCFDVLSGYNISEYRNMPALYLYDSFENCLQDKPDGVFCVVKVAIKPDRRSEIWRLIKKYSKYMFQYNHDVLTRGVCLEKCEALLAGLSEEERQLYYQPKFNISHRHIMSDWMLPNISYYRSRYGKLINMCQNYQLKTEFDLSAYAEIEHCTTNGTIDRPRDSLDVAFLTVLLVLFAFAVGSQIYDARLANASKDPDHYKNALPDKSSTLLTAFSISRNWKRLTYHATRTQYQQDFGFLDFIRTVTMSTILVLHVTIGMGMFTSQNPVVMEQFASHPAVQMVFSLAPFQVDVFFCISGLLLALQFLDATENKSFRWSILWQGFVNRYLRSLPVYSVLLLFTVSWYDKLLTTPSAYKIMPKMRLICREKWWSNLLFINNYYQPEEQCLIHTWYLAADFQLFIVGMVIMTLLWRFPKAARGMAIVMCGCGFLLPAVNTYLYRLDAMMPLTMKGSEYQLWFDEYFVRSYQAMETHCSSYFGGMIAGMMYHKMIGKQLTYSLPTFRNIQTVVLIMVVACTIQAPLYNMINFEKPSVWMSIISGVHKASFATLYSVLFLRLAMDGTSGFRRWTKNNTVCRLMAKLGFGFYLMQMSVLKILFANYPETIRANWQLFISTYCASFMVSYVVALLAFLLIEKPFDVFFKLLLGKGGGKRVQQPANMGKLENYNSPTLPLTVVTNRH